LKVHFVGLRLVERRINRQAMMPKET